MEFFYLQRGVRGPKSSIYQKFLSSDRIPLRTVCGESLGYKYKDTLMVSLLGMVDDLLGITEDGYEQINKSINLKAA